MNALALYHRMPPWARNLAASIRGWQLARWRYGPDSEPLTEQALRRDYWTAGQWEDWRRQRLEFILRRAVEQVPHYRRIWKDRGDWRRLENWPILEKQDLHRSPRSFVASDRDPAKLFHDHTSGTSGTPLDIWLSREVVRGWYALFEARCRHWYGVSRHDRWAILGGQLVAPRAQAKPPYWVWNAGLNQLYMSSYHFSADTIADYLDALGRYRVRYLLGYTSSLFELASTALARGLSAPQMQVAITNAEPVFDYQREAIQRVFGCPVRETYGMAEIAAAASECEHGRLHLWPEAGIAEVVDGDLVCTGLFNPDMPLIRYRTGDRVTLDDAGPCPCRRTLPVLASIEGRVDDVLYTAAGRRVGRLDPVFKQGIPIHEAQIVQEAIDLIRVRYVPAQGFGPATENVIAERLRDRAGPMRVEFESMTAIPRGANGKFRAVVCNLPPSQHPAKS